MISSTPLSEKHKLHVDKMPGWNQEPKAEGSRGVWMCKAAPPSLDTPVRRVWGSCRWQLPPSCAQWASLVAHLWPMCDTSPNSIKNEVNGSGKNSKMPHGMYLEPTAQTAGQGHLQHRTLRSLAFIPHVDTWTNWEWFGAVLLYLSTETIAGFNEFKKWQIIPKTVPPAASQPPPRSTWFTQHPESFNKVTRRQEQDNPFPTGPSHLQNCRFWCQPGGRNIHFCSLKSALGSGFMHKRSTGGLIKPLCPIIHKWSTLCSHTSVVLSKPPQALPRKPVRGLAGGTLHIIQLKGGGKNVTKLQSD